MAVLQNKAVHRVILNLFFLQYLADAKKAQQNLESSFKHLESVSYVMRSSIKTSCLVHVREQVVVDLNHAYAKFCGKALFDQTDICIFPGNLFTCTTIQSEIKTFKQ